MTDFPSGCFINIQEFNMTNEEFVGIDVAKDKFDVCLQQENGSSAQGVFNNHPTGFKEFVVWLKTHSKAPWIGMEATGYYSEVLADFLVSQGMKVSVINPLQIKCFSKMKLARNKNDQIDAKIIAHYVQLMNPSLFKPRSSEQKYIRELVQLEETLRSHRSQLKLQLSCAQSGEIRKEFEKSIKQLDKRLKALGETLENSFKAYEPWQPLVQLLTGIKGVGALSAYRLLAYLPDISFFKSAKQLAAFIGVSPKQKTSGKYIGETKLSKLGDSRLRKILYMPAMNAKRFNPALQPFVNRLKSKGMAPKAIVGAVMRKLVHIIFGVLKNKTAFNPDLV
ncbi:MAG: IS110 family transposase [Bacteroidota bacterium]|nr:IS110 family transposase [Bacteroidota bacterium]